MFSSQAQPVGFFKKSKVCVFGLFLGRAFLTSLLTSGVSSVSKFSDSALSDSGSLQPVRVTWFYSFVLLISFISSSSQIPPFKSSSFLTLKPQNFRPIHTHQNPKSGWSWAFGMEIGVWLLVTEERDLV